MNVQSIKWLYICFVLHVDWGKCASYIHNCEWRPCCSSVNVRRAHEHNTRSHPLAFTVKKLFCKSFLHLSFTIKRLIFSSPRWHWYGVWGLSAIMNSIFQSSNYTPGGAPCNPQDTSPCLSDDMGISRSSAGPDVSGVQTGFNMEHLPKTLPQFYLCIVRARLCFCFDELSEPHKNQEM